MKLPQAKQSQPWPGVWIFLSWWPGSVLGCGMSPGWWLGAGVPFATLPYIPRAGQSARLQMQIAISGCTTPNLEFIHRQQELKPETMLVPATLSMSIYHLLNSGQELLPWCSSTCGIKGLSVISQVVTGILLKHPLRSSGFFSGADKALRVFAS